MEAEKAANKIGTNFGGNNYGDNFGGNDFGGNNYGDDFGGNDFGNTPASSAKVSIGGVTGENVASTVKAFTLTTAIGVREGSVAAASGFGKFRMFIILALVVVAIIAIYFIYTTFFKKECKYAPRQSAGKDWKCPDGMFDTGRNWDSDQGEKQCASSQECASTLGSIPKPSVPKPSVPQPPALQPSVPKPPAPQPSVPQPPAPQPPAVKTRVTPGRIMREISSNQVEVQYIIPGGVIKTQVVSLISHRMVKDENVIVIIRDSFPYEFVKIQKGGGQPTPLVPKPPAPQPSSSPRPTPTPAPKPSPVPEPSLASSGECSGEGGEPFGTDQEAFYSICEPGKTTPTRMACAEGTLWDTSIGVCNWPLHQSN